MVISTTRDAAVGQGAGHLDELLAVGRAHDGDDAAVEDAAEVVFLAHAALLWRSCPWLDSVPLRPGSDSMPWSSTPVSRMSQALELERQPLVVDAQAVQDRGVQVVDVDRVLDDVVAEVVGLAVDDARLDAAAGHPHA